MTALIEAIGRPVMAFVEECGRVVRVTGLGVLRLLLPPYRLRLLVKQCEFVGLQSLSIVIVTGGFTGAVFAIQAAYGFGLFGAESLTGSTVTLSLVRSIGPVFAALMVTGRAGSAMAAEIGSMRVTEQIDALEAMAVDPIEYLVAPRIFAGTVMVPLLSAVFSMVGIVGAYFVGVEMLHINPGAFLDRIYWYCDPEDLLWGLAKSSVFGFVLTVVGCTKGLYVRGGAEGVGRATTEAVVFSSVSILVLDYFITQFLMSRGLLT